MSTIKHLGKFTDEGDYIELPFTLEEGKYRVEIKPSGENKRDKTVYVGTDGKLKLPNYNGRKAFALGSNIFLVYKIINKQRERVWVDGFSRFSLFLKPQTVIPTDADSIADLLRRVQDLEQELSTILIGLSKFYNLIGVQDDTNAVFNIQHFIQANTLRIYRNGLLQHEDEDYSFDELQTITFFIPPDATELLQASYVVDASELVSDGDDTFLTDGKDSFIQ